MTPAPKPAEKRAFQCSHCHGQVLVPWNLPSTTAPCPHCGGMITSPAPPLDPPGSLPPTLAQIPSTLPARHETAARPGTIPSPDPALPEKPARHAPPVSQSTDRDSRKNPFPAIFATLLLLGLLVGLALYFLKFSSPAPHLRPANASSATAPPDAGIAEETYIRTGWQKDAFRVLDRFIKGTTPAEKAPFILHPETTIAKMDDFYGGGLIADGDTPAEAFSVSDLSEKDRRRGLFLMVYDQPAQLEMKEFFSPIAPIEVQKGLEEPGLLLGALAPIGNFSMEPVRVHAFFKRVGGELKLDWETFVQTKYRTLQTFVELPETGLTQTFRVIIFEDVPGKSIAEPGTRTYRVADPANNSDSARIPVKIDSELGRTLSVLNWRGIQGAKPITRTATVELKWSGPAERPALEISRFLCWEFLGLGGNVVNDSR